MQVDGLKHLGEGHPACLWMAAAAGLADGVGDGPLRCAGPWLPVCRTGVRLAPGGGAPESGLLT